jgi:hypothetical protein
MICRMTEADVLASQVAFAASCVAARLDVCGDTGRSVAVPVPGGVDMVAAANRATAALLAAACGSASAALGADVASPLAPVVRGRLA